MIIYLYFGGDVFYPSGGFDDLRGVFKTLDEAVKAVKADPSDGSKRPITYYSDGWAHIVEFDTETLDFNKVKEFSHDRIEGCVEI